MKIRIAVTSENKLKLAAVAAACQALGIDAQIAGYATQSGVGEQPIGDQTFIGARTRILDLRKRVRDVDKIISIESGVFAESGGWVDRAVIVLYDTHSQKDFSQTSDPVPFPAKFVEMARARGFENTTVGQIMAEQGFVRDAKDPHASIAGVAREVFIQQALVKLIVRIGIDSFRPS